MIKNIIIAILAVSLVYSLYLSLNANHAYKDISISDRINVIEWPEELVSSILDDSTFVYPMEFKMRGKDTLEVGFYHNIDSINNN